VEPISPRTSKLGSTLYKARAHDEVLSPEDIVIRQLELTFLADPLAQLSKRSSLRVVVWQRSSSERAKIQAARHVAELLRDTSQHALAQALLELLEPVDQPLEDEHESLLRISRASSRVAESDAAQLARQQLVYARLERREISLHQRPLRPLLDKLLAEPSGRIEHLAGRLELLPW
jgi:hypothetical protein